MTVSSDVSQIEYTGDAATVVFPIPFYFIQNADLAVYLKRASTGVVSRLVLNTSYTLSGAGDENGGSATLSKAPLDKDQLLIRRELDIVQETDYPPNSIFPAASQERALDRETMVSQQLANLIAHALSRPPLADYFDAHGKRIINLGDPVDQTDAVNLRSVYTAVEKTATGAGNLSVTPKFWPFTSNGTDTDFVLDGADIGDLLFYDVAVNGVLQEPHDDYTVVGNAADGYAARLLTVPAQGADVWVILRGYARPYSGTQPITTVSPVVQTVTGDTTIDNTFQNTIVQVNSADPVTLTIPATTGAATDWQSGDFFSVIQMGTGKVTLAMAATGTLLTLPGFEAQTRGQHSVISASCLYADADQWVATGDLLAQTSAPDVQSFLLPCSDEKTTSIAVETNAYRFRMPYPLQLTDVRATLNVAQSAGTVLTVDVKKNGTSIFARKLTLDNAELTSTTASTAYELAAAPNPTILGDGDLVSVDVTQVGTAGARGLKVQLIGHRG